MKSLQAPACTPVMRQTTQRSTPPAPICTMSFGPWPSPACIKMGFWGNFGVKPKNFSKSRNFLLTESPEFPIIMRLFRRKTAGAAHGGITQLVECRFIPGMSSVRIRLPLPGPLVKWLRHRPFTAVTWVRVPYGSPENASINPVDAFFYAAALDRAILWTHRAPPRPSVQHGACEKGAPSGTLFFLSGASLRRRQPCMTQPDTIKLLPGGTLWKQLYKRKTKWVPCLWDGFFGQYGIAYGCLHAGPGSV